MPSSGQPTKIRKLIRKQDPNGKVYGQLQLTYQKLPEGTNLVAQVAYQEYFIELSKTEADVLQNYKVSVKKEK